MNMNTILFIIKKRNFSKFILYFLILNQSTIGQNLKKIKIKKEDRLYFFQVGPKSDTISTNKNDLFYLRITGNLGCTSRIEVENGRLMKTKNDTTFQLKYIPNLQYEHYFQDSTFNASKPNNASANTNCHKFITHINGANENKGNIIKVTIYNIQSKDVLLNNTYYYR